MAGDAAREIERAVARLKEALESIREIARGIDYSDGATDIIEIATAALAPPPEQEPRQ